MRTVLDIAILFMQEKGVKTSLPVDGEIIKIKQTHHFQGE